MDVLDLAPLETLERGVEVFPGDIVETFTGVSVMDTGTAGALAWAEVSRQAEATGLRETEEGDSRSLRLLLLELRI